MRCNDCNNTADGYIGITPYCPQCAYSIATTGRTCSDCPAPAEGSINGTPYCAEHAARRAWLDSDEEDHGCSTWT